MTVPGPAPFEVDGPLPGPGVTVLEASAGTGKTFTIAALAARYVAEGVPLSELLAVTFTRMATGELRERVRQRLVSAHAQLVAHLDGGAAIDGDDAVATLLATGPRSEVETRRHRLATAVAGFDEATITTTHGFCQLMLASMGVVEGTRSGGSLLENTDGLVEEIVGDLYLRRTLELGHPEFSLATALRVARAALANPDTPLEPSADDSVPGRMRRFAEQVRAEFRLRLQRDDLLTYDHLLVRLRDSLIDVESGPAACARLRARYSVVLIDEFQDTDPIQWEVVSRAFSSGRNTLVLIGDPKQAIYAFRGADVFAYLDAAAAADQRYTLGDNYRSDEDLLRAFDVLLDPLLMGHPDIAYRPVQATPARRRPGLDGAPTTSSLRVRVVHGDEHLLARTAAKKTIVKPEAVDFVAADLAADILALLSSGANLVEWDDDGNERARRPVAPGDVAVLVSTNKQAAIVHEAVRRAGVPAVVASSGSVLSEEAATAWLHLLKALEQPASHSAVAAFALGPFVGIDAEQLVAAGGDVLEELQDRLHRIGATFGSGGVAAAFRATRIEGAVEARLLSQPGGERLLTDLNHVAQLLSAESVTSQLGLPRLRAWLARRMSEGDGGDDAEGRTRRLDTDAEAVQILTVHRAKGLEFPVVYCPYLWDAHFPRSSCEPVIFHDDGNGRQRKLDVGYEGRAADATSTYVAHRAASQDESRGEDLRLLYVALTRAKHQAVMWWAGVDKAQQSPLGRILFDRADNGAVPAASHLASVPSDAEVAGHIDVLASSVPGLLAVERASGPTTQKWCPPLPPAADLERAVLGREVDDTWRRSSYSAITATAYESAIARDTSVGSEPEALGITDEPVGPGRGIAMAGDFSDRESVSGDGGLCLLGNLPAGPDVGTTLHAILERTDFAAFDLESDLEAAVSAETTRRGVALGDHTVVVAGLAAALRTPLGSLAGDLRLCDLSRTDRLDELGFELPVAGGGRSVGAVPVSALAAVLSRFETADGPLAGYAERLADPLLERQLRGYLTGSLDLVLRVNSGEDVHYLVADYKSNRLAAPNEPLMIGHYRHEVLDAEMQRHHYPLQALLYTVALHRYLRWRVPTYDPDRHLGGTLYLFLRGMVGPKTPRSDGVPFGVFGWRPQPALVTELSDLLDAGEAVAETGFGRASGVGAVGTSGHRGAS